MKMLIEVLIELIVRAARKSMKGTLILFCGLNLGCASAPVPESYPVGSAPWEIEARDARIGELEERLSNVEVLLLQTRKAVGEGFEAVVELEEIRQGVKNETGQ